jgi:hypothetical protein
MTTRGRTLGSLACTLVFVVLGCGTARRSEAPPAAGPRPASASPDEDACERGDNESCARAAEALNGASATEEQSARRFRLLKLGCERGHEPSCLEVAFAHGLGRGVKQDAAVATALKRASCERGYEQGCAGWGLALLRIGQGEMHDVQAAAAVCFDGPVKTRAHWCHLLGSSIDEGMAEADLPMLARLYAHACSADFGPGCASHGEILFRQGKRLEGIALLRAKCAQGLADSCGVLEDLLAFVATEERDGGGVLGTPPAPLHLRLPERGLSYDPPDENWGTSPPTHPGLRNATRWRWWRRGGKLIEVVVFEGLPKGNAAIAATMPEVMATGLAHGAPVTKTSGVLGGKACSHAFFAMGAMGRGDVFMLASGDVIYSLLVLQQGISSERLLERAVAGFRLDAK